MSGRGLAVDAAAKEEQRLATLAQKHQDRMASLRKGGAPYDTAELLTQATLKREVAQTAKEEALLESRRAADINALVERAEYDARAARKHELAALRAEWQEQEQERTLRDTRAAAERARPQAPPHETGLSAVVEMAGEDADYSRRTAYQQAQMRRWISMQIQEKEDIKAADDASDAAWGEFAQETTQGADVQGERDAERRQGRAAMESYNQQALAERKAKEAADQSAEAAAKVAEIEHIRNDGFYCEDPAPGFTAEGRIRRDHYKGLSRRLPDFPK